MRGKPSKVAQDFIDNVKAQNIATAKAYETKIGIFNEWVNVHKKTLLDKVVADMKKGRTDPYKFMAEFVRYIQGQNYTVIYQNLTVKTVKFMLKLADVPINDTKFKYTVRLQRAPIEKKRPLDKAEIVDILYKCTDVRLKTYLMFLAGTGARAEEATLIKYGDLHLDDPRQPYVKIRAETTKTKRGRTVYLTTEMVKQFRYYLDWKYRERKIKYEYSGNGERQALNQWFKPNIDDNDEVFRPYHHTGQAWKQHTRSGYIDLCKNFEEMMDRAGMSKREMNNPNRREITFHSFRRHVFTTISKLGQTDYANGFIGHANSTYWTAPEDENIAIFRKLEPYLTYQSQQETEAKTQEIKTQLEDKEDRIRLLEKRLARIDAIMEEKEHYSEVVESLLTKVADPEFNSHIKLTPDLVNKVLDETFKAKVRHSVVKQRLADGRDPDEGLEQEIEERMKAIEYVKKQLRAQGIFDEKGHLIKT